MTAKFLLSTVFMTFAAIGSAHAVLIDSFDQPANGSNRVIITQATCTPSIPCSGANLFNPGPGFGIIGGQRNLATSVVGLAPTNPPSEWNTSAIITNGNAFTHSQTTGVAAHSTVTWNGGGNLNANLRADGSQAFHLRVVRADLAAQWSLTVDDGTNSQTVTFGTGGNENDFDLFVPFAAFGPVDMESVDSIVFVANATDAFAFDTAVDLLDTVPEPATMTLFGAALAGFGLVAMRRRRQAK